MSDRHPNAVLLDGFYAAFERRDGAAMAACYAPDAHFTDPVFSVRGEQVGAMWSMLCERGRDLQLEWRDIQRALGAPLHVFRHRSSGAQRHRFGIHVQGGQNRKPRRHFRSVALEPHGVGDQGCASRLVAIRAQGDPGASAGRTECMDAAPSPRVARAMKILPKASRGTRT